MKIYISGKISGMEDEAKVLFDRAEKYLLSKGYEVVNPMKLEHNENTHWHHYMKTDIIALMECDAIYMLTNWTESKGAVVEFYIADNLEFEIIHENLNNYKQ
jgi:hypothetical protein